MFLGRAARTSLYFSALDRLTLQTPRTAWYRDLNRAADRYEHELLFHYEWLSCILNDDLVGVPTSSYFGVDALLNVSEPRVRVDQRGLHLQGSVWRHPMTMDNVAHLKARIDNLPDAFAFVVWPQFVHLPVLTGCVLKDTIALSFSDVEGLAGYAGQ